MEIVQKLTKGQKILFGGNKFAEVSSGLAEAFQPGDQIVVLNDTGALLHIPSAELSRASQAVDAAQEAFLSLGACSDEAVTTFYATFADLLADDATFAPLAEANRLDVDVAQEKGRSTTRLVLSESMRQDMISGLRMWRDQPSRRGESMLTVAHEGWQVEQLRSGLGIVGFIFEGRPNVFADACGVLRSGNTVVFRIGSDAFETARAIMQHALRPALEAAGLPAGSVNLLETKSRAVGWALFSDTRLGLAVARGSGAAVSQLGSVARQAGISCSLHGTGGAWLVTGEGVDVTRLRDVVEFSLDRKVCNTLNTVCVLASHASEVMPAIWEGLDAAAALRSSTPKVHVAAGSEQLVSAEWFEEKVSIQRASGVEIESRAEVLPLDTLGQEWEWEESPEITLVMVDSVEEAVVLFNTYAPRFVASLISENADEQAAFFTSVDAPFVGDGFTRWVDGQYAFNRPELGLSNWEYGRLFARGAVLSGDSVFTVRSKMTQTDSQVSR